MPPVTRSVTCSVQGEPAAARHVDLGPRLRDALATLPPSIAPATALRTLVDAGLDELPLPGSGHTLDRFRALAAVAAHDLSLAKLYEGHTDALAIMAELGAPPPPPGALVGTWAAEAKDARVAISGRADETRLVGRKAWCSGAARLDHALLTVWGDDRRPSLALVALAQPSVRVTEEGFVAVGMAATESVEVIFEGARARIVGAPGAYLERPGFWQGAVGIAACWYGGAVALARALSDRAARTDDVVLHAHLGAVDTALAGARAMLREAAARIDEAPREDVREIALRTRAVVEAAATTAMAHIGRALGAGPFCRDAVFARRMADLPVFLRQSHAEHDLAALGSLVAKGPPWAL